jgi:glyoxylase-like metal-dependent hydrolase (beta-lactamase superfamily II)
MRRHLLLAALAACFSIAAQSQTPKFDTTEVAPGVYSFRYQFHRNMFVVTDDGVVATDPISKDAATALLGEIRKRTDKPIKYVVYSHEHWDHVSGGQVLKEAGAQFISQENCVAVFKQRPNADVVLPERTFKERLDLKLGSTTIELRSAGRGHGACMSVMVLPKDKLMFAVDIVGHKRVPFRAMPDYHPGDWIQTLKQLERLDVERVIPGHGAPVVPADAIRLTREYLEDLLAAVQEAMTQTHDPDKLKQLVKLPKYQDWTGYETYLPLNVERAWAYLDLGW